MITILVADDDHKLLNMLRRTLSYEGFRVVTANDGQVALSQVEAEQPDAIVLDWLMPGMSGSELADRLNELCPDLKVLYMSGYTDNAIVYHGVLAKGIPFLQKPFTPESLTRKVREVLDG